MAELTPELQSIVENFLAVEQRLQETIARISPEGWSEISPNAGWTYKDLVAHLATGDWICQIILRSLLETGSVPEWPDADAGNAERVRARREKSVAALAEERAQHRNETVRLIEQLQPDHLEAPIDMPWFNVRDARADRPIVGWPFPHHAPLHSPCLPASGGRLS
jgi:uncharacterized protein (TIGR03083 family)